MEYLVHLTYREPVELEAPAAQDLRSAEKRHALRIQAAGILTSIWRDPGHRASWTVWSVESPEELHSQLTSLPYWPWMTANVHPLATHPNAANPSNSG